MDKDDTEGSGKVPYQRGLVTTSLVILVYVLGQGEISPNLSVTVIGLTLHNPHVIEYAMGAVLTWYAWRFMTNNQVFTFRADLLAIVSGQLARRAIYTKVADQLDIPESSRDLSAAGSRGIRISAVNGLLDWTFEQAVKNAHGSIEYQAVVSKPLALLSWKLMVIALWFFIHPSFPDKCIPLLLSLAAAIAGSWHLMG